MKILNYIDPKLFFPESTITIPFGIDNKTFPGNPRCHPIDRALPINKEKRYKDFPIYNPCEVIKTKWIDDNGAGVSILRLIGEGFELRLLHLLREELFPDTRALILNGLPIDKGSIIGPAGNYGLSVSNFGGSGRHVHYSLTLEKGIYDSDLDEKWGNLWKKNDKDNLIKKYGPYLKEDMKNRGGGIKLMNNFLHEYIDPFMKKESYIVDSYNLIKL